MASTCSSGFRKCCRLCSRLGYNSIVSALAETPATLEFNLLCGSQNRFDSRFLARSLATRASLQFPANVTKEAGAVAGADSGSTLDGRGKGTNPKGVIDNSSHPSSTSTSAGSKEFWRPSPKHYGRDHARRYREPVAVDDADGDWNQPRKSGSKEKPKTRLGSVAERDPAEGELTEDSDQQPSAYITVDFADHRAMQLVFLGTSSSIPTWRRSTSCTALRLDGTIFLFDCGEGAVRQILKTPMKHYDIDSIFITHMHGDHIYGLPGLLCRIGLKEFENKKPINIYGPQGLRQWIRSTLTASHGRVHPKYAVHEMVLKRRVTKVPQNWNLVDENHADELPGSDIARSTDGLWHIYSDEKYVVRAGFLRHTIPCWGYVVEEHTRRGRFNVDRALEAGVKPGPYFRILESGNSVTLADGKVVSASDVLGPPRRGRKVVILGDTCDSTSIENAAREADVVVHEATVLKENESEVYQRGHSTARMAGTFARVVKAGTLVLTHFSGKLGGAQYYIDERTQERTTIKDLASEAREAFRKNSVIAADDFTAVTIPFPLVDKPPIRQAA